MSDKVKEGPQTTHTASTIETNDASDINCLTLPKVILTRIDISKLPVPAVQKSQSLLEYKIFKKRSVGRPPKTKSSTKQTLIQKKRKREAKKKELSQKSKAKGPRGLFEAKGLKQNILSTVKSRVSSRSQVSIKSMLKNTSIQQRNTASPKTYKQTMKLNKQFPVKNKSNFKFKNVDIKITNTNNTASSEDEFLYDELIEELENTSKAGLPSVKTVFEKTTNIKLKQSSGNKAPTIVKGGIIKKTKLPPDLRPVSSPTSNSLRTANRTKGAVSSQPPTRKDSSWPILTSPVAKINKKYSEKIISFQNPLADFKPPQPLKPRIGPKQTLKVGPLFNSNTEDNSDEYSEIETLENDYLDVSTFSKSIDASCKTTTNQNISPKPEVFNSLKGDEDPNLDLIRILSDDTDDAVEIKLTRNSESNVDSYKNNIDPIGESTEKSTVETDTPHIRTIYELMNEISLQNPSWNLHIVPETNAFCIAQVTKGRLGIPTMKKCIELDSINFYGRVYIHQYHIKKFDGLYDSEESILALFQEIHSIKA